MYAYANVHLALDAMRIKAQRKVQGNPPSGGMPYDGNNQDSEPPRVLILGPDNSGKTTIAKILVNYATRAGQDWCPMLVNVDPGEVSFSDLVVCCTRSHGTHECREHLCCRERSLRLQYLRRCKRQHRRIRWGVLLPVPRRTCHRIHSFRLHIGTATLG